MRYCLKNIQQAPDIDLISFSDNKANIIKRVEFIISHKRHGAYRLLSAAMLSITLILAPAFCYRLTETIFDILPSKFKYQEVIDTNKQII